MNGESLFWNLVIGFSIRYYSFFPSTLFSFRGVVVKKMCFLFIYSPEIGNVLYITEVVRATQRYKKKKYNEKTQSQMHINQATSLINLNDLLVTERWLGLRYKATRWMNWFYYDECFFFALICPFQLFYICIDSTFLTSHLPTKVHKYPVSTFFFVF